MLKTCAQAVGGHRINMAYGELLSTQPGTNHIGEWTNTLVFPPRMHSFFIQLCTPNLPALTSVVAHFSPLSTPLIMNNKDQNKENILLSRRG
jgi:hypothetical protein